MAALGAGAVEAGLPMIDKREILEAASALGLLPNVVEKDYVLGWVLAGIHAHPELYTAPQSFDAAGPLLGGLHVPALRARERDMARLRLTRTRLHAISK